ncbi:MAG: DUF4230 domain-containing protein [Flavobacteriaceae bacterium]|nr:MAG: DUF4230 domain-containing protein [Flavobacteriaceae bacterium]
MEFVLIFFLILIVGSGWYFFLRKKKEEQNQLQAGIILDKLKTVCKLVTVEGNFSEIYHYQSKQSSLLDFLGKKKALVIVQAKASVGYDLSKIVLRADDKNKKVYLSAFPEPQVLHLETDYKYYDTKDSLLNRFDANDMTLLNQEAKDFISEKIPQSGLLESAKKEALSAIFIMEKLVETIGWTLEVDGLLLDEPKENLTLPNKPALSHENPKPNPTV